VTEELAKAVRRLVRRSLASQPPDRKNGRVAGTNPLEVLFPGDAFATVIRVKAASYQPTVGDVVVVERVGSTWVAVYSIEGL